MCNFPLEGDTLEKAANYYKTIDLAKETSDSDGNVKEGTLDVKKLKEIYNMENMRADKVCVMINYKK